LSAFNKVIKEIQLSMRLEIQKFAYQGINLIFAIRLKTEIINYLNKTKWQTQAISM
jgi:hypothetical protein